MSKYCFASSQFIWIYLIFDYRSIVKRHQGTDSAPNQTWGNHMGSDSHPMVKHQRMQQWMYQAKSSTRIKSKWAINRFLHNWACQTQRKTPIHKVCQPKVAYRGQWKHQASLEIHKQLNQMHSLNSLTCQTNKQIRTEDRREVRRTSSSERIQASRSCRRMGGRSRARRCPILYRWNGRRLNMQTIIVLWLERKAQQYLQIITTITSEPRLKLWRRTWSPKRANCCLKVETWTLKTRPCCWTRVRTTSARAKARR